MMLLPTSKDPTKSYSGQESRYNKQSAKEVHHSEASQEMGRSGKSRSLEVYANATLALYLHRRWLLAFTTTSQ